MSRNKNLGTVGVALLVIVTVILILAPGASAQAKFKTLYTFTGGADGSIPLASPILDAAGNLYGTTQGGGKGNGTVFKLTPETGRKLDRERAIQLQGRPQRRTASLCWPGLRPVRKSLRHNTDRRFFWIWRCFRAQSETRWKLD
jgi:uncharacterized repeat protein (TIGR03803 family)